MLKDQWTTADVIGGLFLILGFAAPSFIFSVATLIEVFSR